MRLVSCPACHTSIDLDSVGDYSPRLGKTGKFCTCGEPLDVQAVESSDWSYGNAESSARVKAAKIAAVEAMHANATTSINPNATPAPAPADDLSHISTDALAAVLAARAGA